MKKIINVITLLLTSATLMFAQLTIEISDNMQVETTGGVYISGAVDVIENGSGYLKGVVESSSLSGATQFAGLTFGSGYSGTITRTTGTALSAATPKTFLRSYKLVSGSVLNTSLSSKYISTGANDEDNNIGTPFIYKKVGAAWTGYSNNTTSPNVASAASVSIPNGTSEFTISEGIGVAARIFLEGPYSTGTMSTSIHGLIPAASPYTEAPRTASAIPANAVDWVLVSLRNTTSPFAVVASHSAFVKNNGMIIDDNGNEFTGVPASAPGTYKISVKHRNHLAVMTNTNPSLTWASN